METHLTPKVGQRPYSTRPSRITLSTNPLTTLCLARSRWCSRIIDVELRLFGRFVGIELCIISITRHIPRKESRGGKRTEKSDTKYNPKNVKIALKKWNGALDAYRRAKEGSMTTMDTDHPLVRRATTGFDQALEQEEASKKSDGFNPSHVVLPVALLLIPIAAVVVVRMRWGSRS